MDGWTITSYIMFCEGNIIRTKTVRIYPNNKLWVTSDLKNCINQKKLAFVNGNTELVKEKRCELRAKLKKAKTEYKDKVEKHFYFDSAKRA